MTGGDEIPVDEFGDGGEVVGAFVLVFEVVGVFPNVDSEERFCAGHQGRVLVWSGFHDEFCVADGEPYPAAPEHFEACCDELFFEGLLGFEMGFDVFEECSGGGWAAFFEALPEERMVCVAAALVAEIVADVVGLSVELGEQSIEGFGGEVRMFCERLVEFCDVRGVMFIVMDFHRFRVDERFEGVVIVAECWNLVGFGGILCDGAFGCGAEGDGAGGQSEGFQTFTTGDHSGFSF